MIFNEIYGAYYNTVAKILKAAVAHPLTQTELRRIIEENAFGESILNIEPALESEQWQLLFRDGSTPIKNAPALPPTTLEKMWLKSLSLDPRVKLFGMDFTGSEDVEPLFTRDDYCVFDRYADGDNYEDEAYIKHFRLILDAIKNHYPLGINTLNRKNAVTYTVIMPEYLEYSEKDDKFRLIGSGCRYGNTINLGRIVSCKRYNKPFIVSSIDSKSHAEQRTVEFELIDERNALERVLLHFAHFEKEAKKLDEGRYLVKIVYSKDDETELVIRVLSFGPMIKVTAPQDFADLIKQRLIAQKSCTGLPPSAQNEAIFSKQVTGNR